MTKSQLAALGFLATVEFATPSAIGQAMGGSKSNKAQGLGRMGGTMAHRLMKLGLVSDSSWHRGGFPSYSITHVGRRALMEARATEPAGEKL